MNKPDFLAIGAAKCGTTSLYHYLKEHPKIWVTPQKETHYFSLQCDDRDFVRPFPNSRSEPAITKEDDYLKQYEGGEGKICGEVCHSYLYVEKAAENIYRFDPNIKLIAILRNPTERACSAYLHLIRTGLNPSISFDRVLEMEELWVKHGINHPIAHLKRVGLYSQQIERFLRFFPRKQIRFYLSEEFDYNTIEVMRDIFEFVGVNANFTPRTEIKYNVSMNCLIMGGKTKASLLNYFAEDIERTAKVINKDLSHWLSW